MKKFLLITLGLLMAFNVSAELKRIDFKWSKVIQFDAMALSEEDFKKGHAGYTTGGQLLINYDDFGSAGSLCTISINAGEKFKDTSFNGTKVTKLEDVIVCYDPDKGSLVIVDKLKENLLWIVGGELKLLLFYNVVPFLSH